MNTTACAIKWASSPELDNGPSSAGKIGERPPVFREREADANLKLTLMDRPVYDLLKKPGDDPAGDFSPSFSRKEKKKEKRENTPAGSTVSPGPPSDHVSDLMEGQL